MANPSSIKSRAGQSVTFTIYARNGAASLVGFSTTLIDAGGDSIDSPVAVSGTLTPAGGPPKNALFGVRLFNALGGTTNSSHDSGYMALAGHAMLDAKGAAKALDITLSYVDQSANNFTCELTNPADLLYSVSKGVGTLTVSSADSATCPAEAPGNSITFNLYAAGAQARIIATSSSFTDGGNGVIVSAAMSGSM